MLKASELYLKFCEWWEKEQSGKPISQNKFGRRVAGKGFKREKIGGYKYYTGMKLKEYNDAHF